MKRQKLMAWLLSIAMAASLAAPAYADDFDTSSDFEEEGFFEEDFDDDMTFEEEVVEEFEASETEADEELLSEEESEINEKFWTDQGEEEEEIEIDADALGSSEELFAEYVDEEFGVQMFSDGSDLGNGKGLGYRKLSGDALAIYKILRSAFAGIADGQIESTQVIIPNEMIDRVFTAEEMGLDEWTGTDADVDALSAAIDERYAISLGLDYLLADCPYDLYWYNKAKGGGVRYGYRYRSNSTMVEILDFTYKFNVSSAYSGTEQYTVDTAKTSAAKNSAINARAIADQAAGLDDYHKLLYFKDQIIGLTDYNDDAVAEDYSGGYGDPWQLIYVFDGDPSTKVVCEGYSKAFQYLYELSSFAGDIESYIVSGPMGGGTGEGPHMWNIVNMDDNKNYIVDVTNCDDGTVGQGDKLFLAGTAGSVSSGYRFDFDARNHVTYRYDAETLSMYDTEELTLASEYYTPNYTTPPTETDTEETETESKETEPESETELESETEPDHEPETLASGSCGLNCTWAIVKYSEVCIVLEVHGTGKMDSYTSAAYTPWTQYRNQITEIDIADGITAIGSSVFGSLPNITHVDIPGSVQVIGNIAFSNCESLKEVLIENYSGMLKINNSAFSSCGSLETVVIPDGIRTIETYAFMDCESLKSVTIGKGTKTMGTAVFDGSPNIKLYLYGGSTAQVYADDHNIPYEIIGEETADVTEQQYEGQCGDDIHWKAEKINGTSEYKLTLTGSGEMWNYLSRDYVPWNRLRITEIQFSDEITRIGDYAFYYQYMTELKLPEDLVSIGENAFAYCKKINELELPNGLKKIEDHAFDYCSNLKSIAIPGSVEVIGVGAIQRCGKLEKVDLEEGLQEIQYNAFLDCPELKCVTIPYSVKKIGNKAFGYYYVNNRATLIPDFVIKGYEGSFAQAYAADNGIPFEVIGTAPIEEMTGMCGEHLTWKLNSDGVLTVEGTGEMYTYDYGERDRQPWHDQALSIKKVVLSDGVTSVGSCAFYRCQNINEISFSETVTNIGFLAFADCYGLMELHLPESLRVLGQQSFDGCGGLTEVRIPGGVRGIMGSVFDECDALERIYVDWNAANGYAMTVGNLPFGYCKNLKQIDVNPEHRILRSIDGVLYFNNTLVQYPIGKLDEVFVVDASCDELFIMSFTGVEHLKTLIIPDTVKSLQDSVFGYSHIGKVENIIICSALAINDAKPFKNVSGVNFFYPGTVNQIALSGLMKEVGDNFTAIPYDEHVVLAYEKVAECTCTEDGRSEGKCVICGEVITQTTSAPGHSLGDWTMVKEPGCEITGLEKRVCANCDYYETQETRAKGHIWDSEYTVDQEPTCAAPGSESIHCKNCDATKDARSIAKKAHELGAWTTVKTPTCTDIGIQEHACKNCAFKERRAIPAKGHKWSDWKVTKEPTITETGLKERSCSVCKETETEKIPKIEKVVATGITLNVTAQKIKNGETFVLTATASPEGAETPEVTWTSSKPKYATVSEDGVVTAVCPGSAVITCTTTDGTNLKATCTITVEPADDVEAFVVRMYQICMDRNPDASGLAYWTEPLRNQTESGLEVAKGFVYSNEFQKKDMTDEEFIGYMYNAFLGRGADKGGMSYWLGEMAKGKTRDDVFMGFADSNEFEKICNNYGIVKDLGDKEILATGLKLNVTTQKVKNGKTYQLTATVTPSDATNKAVTWTSSKPKIATVSDKGLVTAVCPGTAVITCTTADGTNIKATCTITVEPADDIEAFVIRLYSTCLNRNPDATGLKYWADRLRSKKETGRSAAHGFIFSDEFINRKYNDEDFIEQMYKAFFGRGSDKGGKTYWLNEMAKGKTREDVFDGFVVSNEFAKMCEQYGIARD